MILTAPTFFGFEFSHFGRMRSKYYDLCLVNYDRRRAKPKTRASRLCESYLNVLTSGRVAIEIMIAPSLHRSTCAGVNFIVRRPTCTTSSSFVSDQRSNCNRFHYGSSALSAKKSR